MCSFILKEVLMPKMWEEEAEEAMEEKTMTINSVRKNQEENWIGSSWLL